MRTLPQRLGGLCVFIFVGLAVIVIICSAALSMFGMADLSLDLLGIAILFLGVSLFGLVACMFWDDWQRQSGGRG